MRLDTLGPVNDFIIHAIAVSWQTSAYIVPLGLFYILVIGPVLTWRTFFPYSIFCFSLYYYIVSPFLLFLSIHISSNVISFFYVIFFSLYYVFFCAALFERVWKFELKYHVSNYKLITEEENIIKDGLFYYRKIIFIGVPIFLVFYCFSTFIYFTFIYVRNW